MKQLLIKNPLKIYLSIPFNHLFIPDKEYTIGGAGTIICRNIDEVRMLKILVLLLEADPDKFDESGLSEKYGFKHFEVSDPFNISNRFSFASKFVLK